MLLDRIVRRVSAFFEMRRARRSMGQIAAVQLSPSRAFSVIKDAATQIEGMFSEFSMAIVDSLLSMQSLEGVGGDILEMGVYRGRSATLLGRWLAPGERLILIDIKDYLDRRAIEPFRDAVDYFVQSTAAFKDIASARYRHAVRFIHIDASHDYRATFAELEMADRMLTPLGIIAMDDFTNLNYSQNIAAIFKYLYVSQTDLRIFLVTNEKAYLCRRDAMHSHSTFILSRLIPEMVSRGIEDIFLARTDVDAEYSAFYARERQSGETGHFYGADVYGKFFIEP